MLSEITEDDRRRVAAVERSLGLGEAWSAKEEATFSGGFIEGMVADILGVPSAHRSKLSARIKNLLRLRLLPEISTQRGVATKYTKDQALVILLATMLNYQHMMPEYVVYLISRRRLLIQKSAERGVPMIFHPEGALRGLRADENKKCPRITEVWPVGALQRHLLKYLGDSRL